MPGIACGARNREWARRIYETRKRTDFSEREIMPSFADNDWRLPIAKEFAKVAVIANVQRNERNRLVKLLEQLAQQEETTAEEHRIGFQRILNKYGERGRSQFVTMASDFMPLPTVGYGLDPVEDPVDPVAGLLPDEPLPKTSEPKPPVASPKTEAVTPVCSLRPPICEFVLSIKPNAPCDSKALSETICSYVSFNIKRTDPSRSIEALDSQNLLFGWSDVLIRTDATASEVCDLISKVPWVTDCVTKPDFQFRVFQAAAE